jgi:hypothetical protein
MRRRFTDQQVREIREAYAAGAGQGQLAFYWNVNKKVIQDMVHGRTYKNVSGPLSTANRICPTCRQIVGVRAIAS